MQHKATPTVSDMKNAEYADKTTLLPTYSEDSVDLTLIRWMLSLSPLERLRTAQNYTNSARKLRNAPREI